MTTKIITLFLLYVGLGVFLHSCGIMKYDATICDIRFAALHSTFSTDDQQPDKFGDKIGFEITSIEKSPTCYVPTTFQLFNAAYATTKCAVFQNELLTSTYELYLDRPILLNNDTINANTNLLAIPAIISATTIELFEDCKFVSSTILFQQKLIDKITFEEGIYKVTFNCMTSDDKSFEKTREVIFKE